MSVPVGATMVGAALLMAQFVASKAARDAIYLGQLDVTTLPQIVMASAAVSIGLVAISSFSLRRLSPATFVPATFVASALLFVLEWALADRTPTLVARLLYLHVCGLGPMLSSGFWLIATERFDPRSAKQEFGRIAGVSTFGGVIGGLAAERVATTIDVQSVLLMLAVANALCAWQTRQLAVPLDRQAHAVDMPDLSAAPAERGLGVLAATPYLRHLAALVLLGSVAAALADYVFKAEAVSALGRGDLLLRFFAGYYAATTVITFLVQATANRMALQKLGLAMSTATPSAALLAGGAAAIAAPGLVSAVAARGAESVLRGSLFRSGYEVFYTPVPTADKRAAKSMIDVGFDRVGEGLGAGLVRLVQMVALAAPHAVMLALAMISSAGAAVIAGRLSRGYLRMLERSLMTRAVELDLTDVEDAHTRSVMMRVLRASAPQPAQPAAPAPDTASIDPELQQINELRSRDAARVIAALERDDGIAAPLVPHVIPLLAWDAVADAAMRALQKVAEERVGMLVDALVDPNQPFAVRRRLPRVLAIGVSQRAADGLMLALDDLRFEVRYHCGRALAAIVERNPRVRIDRERVFEAVEREVTVSRSVWESRQLLDSGDQDGRSLADDLVTMRASQSLEHVFTLLALVLPAEPLRIAFRGLHTRDARLRGTALEYLDGVLPNPIKDKLWPFLEAPRVAPRPGRTREQILDDLVRSHKSMKLSLEDLRPSPPGSGGEKS